MRREEQGMEGKQEDEKRSEWKESRQMRREEQGMEGKQADR